MTLPPFLRCTLDEDTGTSGRYRTLLEINNAIITNLAQEDLFRAICEALKKTIHFDRAGLSLHDPEIGALRIFALVGDVAHFSVGQVLPLIDAESGQAFEFRRTRLFRDLETEQEHAIDRLIYAEGLRSYCTVPLIVQNAVIGTLGVGSVNKNQYSEADAAFLKEVAGQVALAVANMKSFEEIKSLSARQAAAGERRRKLLEINNAMITSLTRDQLLESVVAVLRQVAPSDQIGIMSYEQERDEFRIVAIVGPNEVQQFAAEQRVTRDVVLGSRSFDRQHPILTNDLAVDRRTPLIVQGKSIGAMSVASKTKNHYSEAEAQFLQEVAAQVALAVANMKSYEEIATLKARLQAENLALQETAALMGRFAAALSHELNSPLGALKSAVQSSQALALQKGALPPDRRAHAEGMESQLRSTIAASAERLHQVVSRMQRFTNLDRNQVLAVDLNALLEDVVALLESQAKGRVRVELDLKPLPRVVVRPQQMSSVFLSLVQNAVEEANGSERLLLASGQSDSSVQVTIQDDGRGMSAEQLERLFVPSFKVTDGRVATGNWSLFSSRQIVQEHGGRIEIQSSVGKGTLVRVALPC